MRLLLFKPDKEQITETVVLKEMYFCFATTDIKSDKGKDSEVSVGLRYAAHTEDGELIVFTQYYVTTLKELILNGSILGGGYVEFNDYSNDYVFNTNIFYINNKECVITDFVYKENEDGQYEFYGYCNNIYRRYIVPKHIIVGLSIIGRSITCYELEDSSVHEANLWLCGEKQRKECEFHEITDFELVDISRSSKKGKNQHMGAAVFNITMSDKRGIERIKSCVLPYFRKKPLRNRNRTKSLDLLQVMYKDSYLIGGIIGQDINPKGEGFVLFIARMQQKPYDIIVLNLSEDKHKKLLDTISEYC